MGERGFTYIIVLIGVFILIIVGSVGFFLGQKAPGKTGMPFVNQTETEDSSTSEESQGSPSPETSQKPLNITVTGVYQPACTAPSCAATTSLVISGTGFNAKSTLEAMGKENGKTYPGILTNVNADGTQIMFDILNLPCQAYGGNIFDSNTKAKSSSFNFEPTGC